MNKENKGMMPLVIGALVLLVLGGIGYSMVKGQKDTAMNKEKVNAETVSNDASMDNKEEGVMVGGALMTPDKDIVANAMNAKNVTTVVAAVKAAGLVETLQGQGPFTVFAPTNSAFEKLPTGTVETLLKPENKQKLSGILTYHVVAGRYTAKDLTDGMVLKTVNGAELNFTMKDGKVWINESAMVETADVISSNGVTHVIDSVLMPPEPAMAQ